jgi:carbon dioxide concentrating mechanism protein CcmN
MHLQTLRSVGTGWDSLPSQVCANGDVTIHPSAAIAPGVILQAAPNSRIIIAEGVCVGMGAVLNAYEGTIEIDHGATLGAGVLVVGCGKIGSRACVGASTTIFNQSIAPWQVVPAGSLIGDSSRSVEKSSVCDPMNEPKTDPKPEATPVSPEESPSTPPDVEPEDLPDLWESPVAEESVPEASEAVESISEANANPKADRDTTVYGQVYVNRILFTIFPQNRPSNSES